MNRTPNQEQIRTFREKEKLEYLGILEVDNIKQAEMKETFLKYTSEERENYSKPKYIAETSSKG